MRLPARFLLVSLAGLACAAPTEDWPSELVLAGDREVARALLDGLAGFRDSPIGTAAGRAAERIAGCAEVVARAPDVVALLDRLGCAGPPLEPALSRRARPGTLLGFVPRPGGGVFASLRSEGGALRGEVAPVSAAAGIGALFVPGPEAGPPVLGGEGLFHARLRPKGGIDVASLVPGGSQADDLFRLKNDLFTSVVLDGTWELGLYPPIAGRRIPPMALALGFRSQAVAVKAMDAFLEDLGRRWPLHRSPFQLGAAKGACLLDLNIMPEFAPCYVATDRAIVVGWNGQHLETALGRSVAAELGPKGGAIVRFDRFADADRRLAETTRTRPAEIRYAWSRLELSPAASGAGFELRLEPAGR